MIPLLLALSACGNVSNDPFDDDANFLAALPSAERQAVALDADVTDEAARGIGELAELLELSVSVGGAVNGFVAGVFEVLGDVRGLPPAERTDDGRRWGPADVGCDVTGSLLMSRDVTVYAWSAVGHQAGDEPDATVLYGTHYAGVSVAEGDGRFVWDHSRWSSWCGRDEGGLVTVEYDSREGVDLLVSLDDFHLEGEAPHAARYAYARTDELGDFEYRTEQAFDVGDGEATFSVAVRTRWVPGIGGRSDAVITGEALEDREWRWSQCWLGAGRLVYEVDNVGIVDEAGEVGECVFETAAEVERV
jgi:hypothetical protein